jgi:acyl-CoA dehydrogenase
MDFSYSSDVEAMRHRLLAFFAEFIVPNEGEYRDQAARNRRDGNPWQPIALIESLKREAKARGLWNLFLPRSPRAPQGLSNLEYAPLCEIMGRVHWSPEVFNCSAPDTGNMEVLERYGSEEQKARWLEPLLAGEIRSAFLMTEPEVASSDATNIQCSIRRDGDEFVINGRKWFSSGAGDPRCSVYIVMGKTDPDAEPHKQQSQVLVPANTPGITVLRPVTVFGYDDAPHGHMEIELQDVRVPAANVILGEGRGFEIAQGRLGPGRIHHCMRSIGLAERALELLCRRVRTRIAFGRPIADFSVWHERIADSRCMIEQARLLTLIKVVAPNVAEKVIDWAIQAHGAAGVSADFPLAEAWVAARSLRLADGPDEVHRSSIAKMELARSAQGDG